MTSAHVLVPVEPTEAMLEAGESAIHRIGYAMLERDVSGSPETMPDYDAGDQAKEAWSAMLAAAPPPPGGAVGSVIETGEYIITLLGKAVRHEAIRDMAEAIGAFSAAVNAMPPTPREKALEEALRECADDLEELVRQQWGYDERLAHKLKRDLAPVVAARALLGERK